MSSDPVSSVTDTSHELERVRHELAGLQQRRQESSRGTGWLAVPLLVMGTWVLSGQAPGTSQSELEKRVSDLEARLLKGPGSTTRIKAPFEVLDASGSVVLRVAAPKSGEAAVEIRQSARVVGPLEVVDRSGKPILTVSNVALAQVATRGRIHIGRGTADNFGIFVYAATGNRAAVVGEAQSGAGALSAYDEAGKVRAVVSATRGVGEFRIVGDSGNNIASLGGSQEKAGLLALMNPQRKTVVNLTGGLRGGGGMIIGDDAGKGVVELSVGLQGTGLVQIFRPGGQPAAVLGQDENGGVLQINNGAGVNVVNLQTAASGGGYLQMTDKGGKTLLEAGISGMGVGMVRVGPTSVCGPNVASTFGLSSCLMGLPGK